MGTRDLLVIGCAVVIASATPAAVRAAYTMEWQAPEGTSFVTDASDFSFGNERYDMEGDGVRELLVRSGEPYTFHVYSTTGYQILWSFAPAFPSGSSQFFGFFDVDADGFKEALFDDEGQDGGVMCVSWATSVVEWQLPYGYVKAVMDVDGDGWDELLVAWPMAGVLEIWGAGTVAGVGEEGGSASGTTTGTTSGTAVSTVQATPRPIDDTVEIRFDLGQSGRTAVEIFDLQGRLVRALDDTERGSGSHVLSWDCRDGGGRQAPSGTYFCKVSTGPHRRATAFTVVR